MIIHVCSRFHMPQQSKGASKEKAWNFSEVWSNMFVHVFSSLCKVNATQRIAQNCLHMLARSGCDTKKISKSDRNLFRFYTFEGVFSHVSAKWFLHKQEYETDRTCLHDANVTQRRTQKGLKPLLQCTGCRYDCDTKKNARVISRTIWNFPTPDA